MPHQAERRAHGVTVALGRLMWVQRGIVSVASPVTCSPCRHSS